MSSNNQRGLMLGVLLALVMVFSFAMVGDRLYKTKQIKFSEVTQHIRDGKIVEMTIEGQ